MPAEAEHTPHTQTPVRELSSVHRPAVLEHLLSLNEGDRHLRFGYSASDAQISSYVESLDFLHDELLGVFDKSLRLAGVSHLALPPIGQHSSDAEFGVSVIPSWRGRGLGRRLFERAVLCARNFGIDTLIIHTLRENRAMLRIANGAGASVDYDGPDSRAVLRLPKASLLSQLDESIERQAAEWDYQVKRRAAHWSKWWKQAAQFWKASSLKN